MEQLAKLQIEIAGAVDGKTSAELIGLMEKQFGYIDQVISDAVNKIIPDLRSGWGPGYALLYLTEDYIRIIAERQIGIIQATEMQDTEAMRTAQKAYFDAIDKIVQKEVSKALTLNIKFSNIGIHKN